MGNQPTTEDQKLRDGLTGAYSPEWLRQGAAAPEIKTFDGTASDRQWRVQAVVVDMKDFRRLCDHFGFYVGDMILIAVAQTLQELFPHGEVFRFQGDAFGVLFRDGCGDELSEHTAPDARRAIVQGICEANTDVGPATWTPDVTLALLDLTIVRPNHPRDCGVLLWSECERAYEVERASGKSALQRRRIEFSGGP